MRAIRKDMGYEIDVRKMSKEEMHDDGKSIPPEPYELADNCENIMTSEQIRDSVMTEDEFYGKSISLADPNFNEKVSQILDIQTTPTKQEEK